MIGCTYFRRSLPWRPVWTQTGPPPFLHLPGALPPRMATPLRPTRPSSARRPAVGGTPPSTAHAPPGTPRPTGGATRRPCARGASPCPRAGRRGPARWTPLSVVSRLGVGPRVPRTRRDRQTPDQDSWTVRRVARLEPLEGPSRGLGWVGSDPETPVTTDPDPRCPGTHDCLRREKRLLLSNLTFDNTRDTLNLNLKKFFYETGFSLRLKKKYNRPFMIFTLNK